MTDSPPSWRTLARLHRGLQRLDRSERHGAVSALIDDSLLALRANGRGASGVSTEAARSTAARLEAFAAALRRRHAPGALDALLDASEAELGRLLEEMEPGDDPDAAGSGPSALSPG